MTCEEKWVALQSTVITEADEEEKFKDKDSRRQEALQGKAQHGLNTDDIRQVPFNLHKVTPRNCKVHQVGAPPLGKLAQMTSNLRINLVPEHLDKSSRVCRCFINCLIMQDCTKGKKSR